MSKRAFEFALVVPATNEPIGRTSDGRDIYASDSFRRFMEALAIQMGGQGGDAVFNVGADTIDTSGFSANGQVTRTSPTTYTTRAIAGGTGVTVTNGDGAAGNPSVAIGQGVGTGDSPTFAGTTINGNITVTGTVDGRDVAADGGKLDGVEDGATADQSAGEIKTAYESNADTNPFTDAEQTKLSGITAGAEPNAVDSVAGHTGAVTLNSLDLTDGTNLARRNAANTYNSRQTFSGPVRLGAHTAIGSEALSGYIEVEDGSGVTRKLGIVS